MFAPPPQEESIYSLLPPQQLVPEKPPRHHSKVGEQGERCLLVWWRVPSPCGAHACTHGGGSGCCVPHACACVHAGAPHSLMLAMYDAGTPLM